MILKMLKFQNKARFHKILVYERTKSESNKQKNKKKKSNHINAWFGHMKQWR